MCQLTFINLKKKFANLGYATTQSFTNTVTSHKDGCGIFGEKGIWKTSLTPWNCLNFSAQYNKIITDSPVILHVRNASSTGGVKIVDDEHAHPFETESLVLAHNGSLEFRQEKIAKEEKYNGMIDSQMFLSVLEEEYKKGEVDFVTAIKKAIGRFYGKFAFLIFDKIHQQFYAARGESATLFTFPMKITNYKDRSSFDGYIINTERKSLVDGLVLFNNYLINRGYSLDYEKYDEKIEIMKANSVFALGEEIKNVGEVKEEKRTYIQTTPAKSWTGVEDVSTYYNRTYANPLEKELEETSQKLVDYCRKFCVSISYLDAIAFTLYNKSMTTFTKTDFDDLFSALKIMDEKTKETRKEKLWNLAKQYYVDEIHIHREHPLTFPWFFETNEDNFKEIIKETTI